MPASSYLYNIRRAYGNVAAACSKGTFDDAFESVALLRREVKTLEKQYHASRPDLGVADEHALWVELREATLLQKKALAGLARRGETFHNMFKET